MVVDILNYVNEEAVRFVNVLMVCFDFHFFTKILQEEFGRRKLMVPFVFSNRVDLQEAFGGEEILTL